jgi:hypothetical protein
LAPLAFLQSGRIFCNRAWIKERYRTMRTYKRRESVLNVSNLITYLGANSADVSLATLLSA